MQCLEHRASDIPVKIMCLQVQRLSVSEQMLESLDDLSAVCFSDAKIDFGDVSVVCGHGRSFIWVRSGLYSIC